MLGVGALAAGVAAVVGLGVALLTNQGLVLDEAAFPRIAERLNLYHLYFNYNNVMIKYIMSLQSNYPLPTLIN